MTELRIISSNLLHGAANGVTTAQWQRPLGDCVAPEHFESRAGLTPIEAASRDLARLKPDIVLLQETDVRQLRSGYVNQARLIAAAVGCQYVAFQGFYTGRVWGPRFPAPTVKRGDISTGELGADGVCDDYPLGAFGVAILSRYPFVSVRGRRLGAAFPRLKRHGQWDPYPGFNRAALAATVKLPDGRYFNVGTAHLELVETVAAEQLRAAWGVTVAGTAKPVCGVGHPDRKTLTPTLLAGDFNLGLDSSRRVLSAEPGDVQVSAIPSFPARNPQRPIDAFVTAFGCEISELATLTLPISDHCAVIAQCYL